MPNIVCPTCATKLEIDDDMVGQDVQCGSCQQVFKAETETKRSSRRGETDEDETPRKSKYRKDDDEEEDDERSSKRRRSKARYDDEDYDEDYEDRRPRRRRNPNESAYGMGIASLVLGILSLFGTFCLTVNCFWAFIEIVFLALTLLFGLLSLKTAGKWIGVAGLSLGLLSMLIVFIGVVYVWFIA